MTFHFKRVRPFWITAFDVLKDSFLTEPLDLTLQEVTVIFLQFIKEKTIECYQSL